MISLKALTTLCNPEQLTLWNVYSSLNPGRWNHWLPVYKRTVSVLVLKSEGLGGSVCLVIHRIASDRCPPAFSPCPVLSVSSWY